jgi:hypothetical protein
MLWRHAACVAAMLGLLLAPSVAARAESDSTEIPVAESLSPEAQEVLREALNYDPVRELPPKALRAPPKKAPGVNLDWSRTDKPDGSAAMTVKRPLPLVWDASVGADFGLAAPPTTTYQPNSPLPAGKEQNTGAAWTKMSVPGLAAIDARVDRSVDQSKVGATLSRAMPLGNHYAVTLQGGYAVTETGPSPAVGAAPAVTPSQAWSSDRLVKFSILPTGTTFAAGATSSTADTVTHHTFSAEQKLLDSLNVTTTVTDAGTKASSKSITAGFKLKW